MCNGRNSLGNTILHVSRSLPKQALQLPIWYLGPRLYPLRAVRSQARIPFRKSSGFGLQNRARRTRTNTRILRLRNARIGRPAFTKRQQQKTKNHRHHSETLCQETHGKICKKSRRNWKSENCSKNEGGATREENRRVEDEGFEYS